MSQSVEIIGQSANHLGPYPKTIKNEVTTNKLFFSFIKAHYQFRWVFVELLLQ